MIAITSIPAFNDNYLWLIHDDKYAIVVDPGDSKPILEVLEQLNLDLISILITHHHGDHCGGIVALKQKYNCPVWGPANEKIELVDHPCTQNSTIDITLLNLKFQVLSVPGHTSGHIAYFLANSDYSHNVLFPGDTLFSAGCGRLFEGTAKQMWHSIEKIMQLPEDTHIYPAHEYTLANLKFAVEVEPCNTLLSEYLNHVKHLRKIGIPSLPSNLALEKKINPFMRITKQSIIRAAETRSKKTALNNADVFSIIRQWKDSF